MSRLLPISILASLFVVGGSCVTDPVTGESRYSLVDWTPEEELAIGLELAPNLEAQFDAVYPYPEIQEHFGDLIAEMVARSPRRDDFEFRFVILNSSVPNALALPGGFVYVTRGLLEELETEAQFVSVLGHELGHVEHRHALLNQSKGALLGLPSRPLDAIARRLPVGGGAVGAASSIVGAPSSLVRLKFNRSQELEADARGVYFAAELGYDPSDAKRTFELFERLERETPSSAADIAIFRTHPLNSDRVEAIETTIEEDYPELLDRAGTSFRPSSPGFEVLIARIRDRVPAYRHYDEALSALAGAGEPDLPAARDAIERALEQLPQEPLFLILRGELDLIEGELPRALEAFGTAREIYSGQSRGRAHWKPDFYLGAIALEAGELEVAVADLGRAVELYPGNEEIRAFYELAKERAAAR